MVVDVNGDQLRLTPSYAGYHATRGFEPDVHAVLTTRIGAGMSVLDVGAHVGLFSLAAGIRVGSTGRVIAFEPTPATLAILRRHITLNALDDRVEVVPAVVGEEDGETTFFVHEDSMSASISRASVEELRPGEERVTATQIRVPVVTLDGICAAAGLEPNIVKIDVEGAELRVLCGATNVLRSDARILCEIHPAQLHAAGDSEEELLAFLGTHGRAVAKIDERRDGIYHALLVRS